MVLLPQNSGKYASGAWHREREQAIDDYRSVPQERLPFLEVNQTGIYDGYGRYRDANLKMDNVPIDPLAATVQIDQRDKPEVGH